MFKSHRTSHGLSYW